jgi:amino acid adenylation domain-containing protein
VTATLGPVALSAKRRALLDALLREEPDAGAARAAIASVPPAPHYPLSFSQRRLWFLNQLAPGNPFYNVTVVLPLKLWLNVPALERSLDELSGRHETLRTTFTVVDGEPVQVIAPTARVSLSQADLRALAPAERDAEASRLASEEAQRPFDLKRGPLFRPALLRKTVDEYVLVLTLHHIVCDGWSLDVLARDLTELYQAYIRHVRAELPKLPVRYVDYAVWQKRRLDGDSVAEDVDYWRHRLRGAATLELPIDHPRPAVTTYRGAQVDMLVPEQPAAALRRLCRDEDATTFMALLAVFGVLLHRHTGQHDISVGVPISGRNRVETENLIGLFVNTLVLRADLSGGPTFRETVRRIREAATEAYAHQELPFERLVEELQPERDMSRNPLFQVMFQFLEPLARTDDARVPAPARPDVHRGVSIFDLALHLTEHAGGFVGTLQYSTDLFEASTVERIAERFRVVLRAAVSDPDRPIAELEVMTGEERAQILPCRDAPERRTAPGAAVLVMERLHAVIAVRSTGTAIEAGSATLSYAGLGERVERLAGRLRKLGAAPGAIVALCLPRSLEFVLGTLAILETGAASLPIDPAEPSARTALMLRRADLVVTRSALAPALDGQGRPMLFVDAGEDDAGGNGGGHDCRRDRRRAPTGQDLAYVVHTSGSTGVPKGVAMPHAALAHLVDWQVRRPGFKAGARVAQYAATTFDVSFQEIFSTLCSGGTLVLFDEETRSDPWALWDTVARRGIERLFVPCVALQQLAEAEQGWQRPGLRLREVITAGERLKVTPAIASLFEHLSRCTLDNHYGPSETHVATAHRLTGPPRSWPPLPPIGRPIDGVTVCVLDGYGRPVPSGVIGELCVGGAGLARGYLAQPALTADRFVPDPFSADPGARLYRTGDLVRHLPDGNLAFLRRADEQVKLRGYRIEPGEVEVALGAHAAVREATVVLREDGGGARLVAFVAPAIPPDDADEFAAELRRFVRGRLPTYMTPSAVELIDAMPLTASGKIDRGALSRKPLSSARIAVERPRTQLEAQIALIWAAVLGRDNLGLFDGFFTELGGHSLLATQVVSAVRDKFGIEVPLTRLFEAPTIADFSSAIVADLAGALAPEPERA